MYVYVRKSFFNSTIVSLGLVVVMYLNTKKLLTFWNLAIFLIILLLLFSFVLSFKKERQFDTNF
jgi:hypothetical protein